MARFAVVVAALSMSAVADAISLQSQKTEASQSAILRSGSLLERVFGGEEGKRRGFDLALIQSAFQEQNGLFTHKQAQQLFKKLGQDPNGMAKYVAEKLLPQAEETTQTLQAEVDAAMAEVNNCSDLMWNAETSLQHREKILASEEGAEYQCIAKLNELHHAEKESCDKVTRYSIALNEPQKVKELKSTTDGSVEAALKANMDFYTAQVPKFDTLAQECAAAGEAAKAKDAECDVDEETAKKFYCHMKVGRDEACANYDKCYADATKKYEAILVSVKATEKDNKDHFIKMACSSWMEESSPCAGETADTSHLDVTYTDEPQKAVCPEIMKSSQHDKDYKCGSEASGDEVADEAAADNATAPAEDAAEDAGDDAAADEGEDKADAADDAAPANGTAAANETK